MQAASHSTTLSDSYQAGSEIGAALSELEPEVLLLFCSIQYDFEELFDGLRDELGRSDTLLFGGTGDGWYGTAGGNNFGVSALGLNSGGKVRWFADVQTGVAENSFAAARTCSERVKKAAGGGIDLAVLLADLVGDGARVVDGAVEVLNAPIVGGVTGDEWRFEKGYVFLNDKAYRDAVGLLAASGDIVFDIGVGCGWKPIGRFGIVEEVEGNIVKRIGDKTAFDFLTEQFGMPPADVELGILSLAIYPDNNEQFFTRTAKKIDIKSGSITYIGAVDKGTPVRICNADDADVLEGVQTALDQLKHPPFKPACALMVSCGARKWLLGDDIGKEIDMFHEALGSRLPLTGFPSFGEIGPLPASGVDRSRSYFHNVSIVALLIGE